jgi:plasmid stabilization system protein ParE
LAVFLSNQAWSDLERIVACIAPHDAAAAGRMGNQLLDAASRTFLVNRENCNRTNAARGGGGNLK